MGKGKLREMISVCIVVRASVCAKGMQAASRETYGVGGSRLTVSICSCCGAVVLWCCGAPVAAIRFAEKNAGHADQKMVTCNYVMSIPLEFGEPQ